MENNLLWPLNTRQHEFKMRRQELRNTYKENCAMLADQLQAVKDLHRKEEEEMRAKFEQRKNEMFKDYNEAVKAIAIEEDKLKVDFAAWKNEGLREAAVKVYNAWMGGEMNDVREAMAELGAVLERHA